MLSRAIFSCLRSSHRVLLSQTFKLGGWVLLRIHWGDLVDTGDPIIHQVIQLRRRWALDTLPLLYSFAPLVLGGPERGSWGIALDHALWLALLNLSNLCWLLSLPWDWLGESTRRVKGLLFQIFHRFAEFLLSKASWGCQRWIFGFVSTTASRHIIFVIFLKWRVLSLTSWVTPVTELEVWSWIWNCNACLGGKVLICLITKPIILRSNHSKLSSCRVAHDPNILVRLKPPLRPERL